MNRIIKLSAFTLGVILCMSFTQVPSTPELSLNGLLKLMMQYEDIDEASTSGLEYLFEDGYENGEVEAIRYVYGRDVKKGKEGVFGYEVLPTSLHAVYFTYSLNTCRQASLYFVDNISILIACTTMAMTTQQSLSSTPQDCKTVSSASNWKFMLNRKLSLKQIK